MDFLDNLLGPFNFFDRLEGLIRGLLYRDAGHRITVKYADRGGSHSRQEIEKILKKYHIVVYGRLHDANHLSFLVKRRQARWAEYLLLQAGVAVVGEPVDKRNQGYRKGKPAGWMPMPWDDKPRRRYPPS
jgi:hypothetical protein